MLSGPGTTNEQWAFRPMGLSRPSAGGQWPIWDFLAHPTKDSERVCPSIRLGHISKVGCESVRPQRQPKPNRFHQGANVASRATVFFSPPPFVRPRCPPPRLTRRASPFRRKRAQSGLSMSSRATPRDSTARERETRSWKSSLPQGRRTTSHTVCSTLAAGSQSH